MRPPVIDRKLLDRFVHRAADVLTGDWVIIGGTVLPLLGHNYRATHDIDCVSCGDAPQSETVKLMEIALELGLEVDTINQAGAFFLKRVPNFQKRLVEVVSGKKGRVLRPNVSLFIELKIARLSESDLRDCLEILKIEKVTKDVLTVIGRAKKKKVTVEFRDRLIVLEQAVERAIEA